MEHNKSGVVKSTAKEEIYEEIEKFSPESQKLGKLVAYTHINVGEN